jgi:hypothetical protein
MGYFRNAAPSNSDDTIDSREVDARIEELESEREDLSTALEEAQEAADSLPEDASPEEEAHARQAVAVALSDLRRWDESPEGEELKHLEAFKAEAEGYCDWRHGETLIHEDHFTKYAETLVSDIGGLPRDIPDYIVIDWEATADNLKADYGTADFDGQTYYYRNH